MRRLTRGLFLVGGIIASACTLARPTPAGADVIRLKDGSQIEGEIHKSDDGWLVTGANGKNVLVPADRVASIEARSKAGVDVAEQHLSSLRRAVENISDIRQILARYKTFADQHPGTAAAEKAKADVQMWQDRLDRDLVKVGDKWLTRDEKVAVIAGSDAAAGEALVLLKQSKLREAGPRLDQILAQNPQNAAAWYLKGVLLYRQDQLPQSRKAFESVIALLPDHAPSLNNIAVIYWRQNQPVVALGLYDKALLAAPNRRDIIDNIAEALDALPEESRSALLTRKLVRHFNEQDVALQVTMQKQGLFRWGATWVAAADLEKLKDAESQIKGKLEKLAGDFDALTARISRIDADLQSDTQLVQRMETDSYGRDPATGTLVRYPYPASYYDVVHDLKALRNERAERLVEQDRMRKQAKTLQQSLPSPKFTGIQRVIDADGAPISAAVLAAAIAPPPPAIAAPVNPIPMVPAPAAPVAPAPAPPVGPIAAIPPTQPVPQVAPSAMPITPASPASASPAPSLPRHTVVPPEKPSILDRDLSGPGGELERR